MTSISVSDIEATITPAQLVKFRPAGRLTKLLASFRSGDTPLPPKAGEPVISLYQPTSGTEFDTHCRHSLLLSTADSSRNPLFHQACVYLPEHDELYVTSNLLQTTTSSSLPIVLISRIKLHRRSDRDSDDDGADEDGDEDDSSDDVVAIDWQKLRPPQVMTMPAGGTRYANGMVFCSQGNLTEGTGGLYYMPRGKPPTALVTGFYGRDFNSPYDVALARDGALWFTDPCYGFEKEFRRNPVLPCHVYRFHPESEDLRVVADGLTRPTGIAFSLDESTAYITDTDASRVDGDPHPPRAPLIYAFDVITRANSPFLANKRVFAVPTKGFPSCISCDKKGYVYAGCLGGIEVWNSGGMLQAVIEIPGGVSSFCFGSQDARALEMFVCAEQRLWRLRFGCDGKWAFQVERAGWLEWSERTSMVAAVPQ